MAVAMGTHQPCWTLHWQEWAAHTLFSGASNLLCFSVCVCLSLQAEPSPCSGVPELVLEAHSTPILHPVGLAHSLRISCCSSAVDRALWAFCHHMGEGGVGLWEKRESPKLSKCSYTVRSPKQATPEENVSQDCKLAKSKPVNPFPNSYCLSLFP